MTQGNGCICIGGGLLPMCLGACLACQGSVTCLVSGGPFREGLYHAVLNATVLHHGALSIVATPVQAMTSFVVLDNGTDPLLRDCGTGGLA